MIRRRVLDGIRKIKKNNGSFSYEIQVIEPTTYAKDKITVNFAGQGAGLVEPDVGFIQEKVGKSVPELTNSENEKAS